MLTAPDNFVKLQKLVELLRAKAEKLLTDVELYPDKTAFRRCGKVDGLTWAADHLETVLKEIK